MASAFEISTTVEVDIPRMEGTRHGWVEVRLNCKEADETGACPSISVNVPIEVTDADSIAQIDAAGRAKARQLLGDALKAIQDG